MKLNKLYYVVALASVLALGTSCADDYQKLNQDPANVTVTDPKALMSQAILTFQPNDYLIWWYNVNYYTRWDQMATPTGGFGDSFTEQAENGGQGSQYIGVLKYRNAIKSYIDSNELENLRGYEAACTVLSVYLGMFDSDMYGALPYTEACHYADQQILTPKYDTVEELYNTFLTELDQAISYFTRSDVESSPALDQVYAGDWAKWAKLANSLKLRVAARLYNNNPSKALSIVSEVANASVGYMDSLDDDMKFNKAQSTNGGDQDYVYGTGNSLATPGASANVLKFMMDSKDPRIRFIYTKNSLNSTVIQGFIDAGKYKNLPDEVKQNVVLDKDGNFDHWGGMGEPWVRYIGLPVVMNGSIKPEYAKYFNYGTDYQLNVEGTNKSYYPFSVQSTEQKKGRDNFTVPTLGSKVIQDTEDNPLYIMYLTAAEVNLYLAEFKLLGANLPQSAEYYYNRGVRFSVQDYDWLAAKNKIPYYGTTYGYDPHEVVIDLKDGEIDAMMATDNIKLTGSTADQLEKVYLQQLIHFSLLPEDQFVTARRSGYPKIGSSLLPFVKFDDVVLTAIPRRFEIATPDPTDVMYDIKTAIYKEQGFNTLGSGNSGSSYNLTGTALNTERVWQDKNAPQWGTPINQ